MELIYANNKVEQQCTSIKAANKLFGGDAVLVRCLLARVNALKEAWRIILQPLDETKKPYNPCNIDELAGIVKIVEIAEVSRHYE